MVVLKKKFVVVVEVLLLVLKMKFVVVVELLLQHVSSLCIDY